MNLHQDPRWQRKRPADLRHEAEQLRHHVRDKDGDQRRASNREERGVNQRLLDPIAEIFRLHQMFYESQQNFRKRAARFARGNQIDEQRWKNSRHFAKRLRKTAAIDQRSVQSPRHLLNPWLLEPFFQDRQSLIQGHPGLEQMRQLLCENEQLTLWNLQTLRWRLGYCRRFLLIKTFPPNSDRIDSDRDAPLLLDLMNCDRAIGAIQDAFDELALGVACSISKLWHRTGN